MLANDRGQLLWARRVGGHDAWQFPQGGIGAGESPEEALFRELREEVGLARDAVQLLAATRGWMRYRLPRRYIREGQQPRCIGQKQKWFALRFMGEDGEINVLAPGGGHKPEFVEWRWEPMRNLPGLIIPFKRPVYERVVKEFSRFAK